MPKKDYLIICFSIKENGENVKLGENDLLFMTVSSSPNKDNYKFQKSLDNGITYNEDTGKYEIEINSEDTNDLKYKFPYGYDITVYYDGNKPSQKVVGEFKVTNKYTLNDVEV